MHFSASCHALSNERNQPQSVESIDAQLLASIGALKGSQIRIYADNWRNTMVSVNSVRSIMQDAISDALRTHWRLLMFQGQTAHHVVCRPLAVNSKPSRSVAPWNMRS